MTSEPFTYRSPHPSVEVPEANLFDLVRTTAGRCSARPAIVDAPSGEQLSYGELADRIGRVGAGLAARDFAPGDVLALVAPNQPDWPVAALGAMAAGGAVTGVNPGSTSEELTHQLTDASASLVVTDATCLGTVGVAAGDAAIREVFAFGSPPGATPFAQLVEHDLPRPEVVIGPDDLAALPYSSGTTGRSKGVRLTHRTIVANLTQCDAVLPIEPGDVVLGFLPMFHIVGFSVVTLAVLTRGGSLVTLPRFEPVSFLLAIQDHRVNKLFVVPPVMGFLAAHPMVDDYDLGSLEFVGCGAAPLGLAIEQRAAERLGCEVGQGYGMTESSGVVTLPTPGAIRAGSTGRLLPDTEARVVEPGGGAALGPGETGELWFRGPQAFRGYLHDPEATAATIDADGWVHTGDVAHFDADGYLFVTDRLKELIKVKGFQVAPAELEALLVSNPEVADAAVVGRADERAGEVPVAYVVARGDDLDVDALKSWVAGHVADYKELADVIVCDQIPKNPSGKILRRVLREAERNRP